MGVADNRSYKDEYHFKDFEWGAEDHNPSLNVDPKINATIKENPYRSNVEIEGDEIVLQPDLTALFKASGKKHSKGGMDVLLKPDSFVFSDFDELGLSKKELELFELKEGGKHSGNTPAKVLKKNVDLKHYNTLVTILEDPYKDDLAKKSATRMLEKYLATLGNIAYIQEEKKSFPQGIPMFAMGTAPVYNPELKEEIDANKQYMKAGGQIESFQWGGLKAARLRKQIEDCISRGDCKDDIGIPIGSKVRKPSTPAKRSPTSPFISSNLDPLVPVEREKKDFTIGQPTPHAPNLNFLPDDTPKVSEIDVVPQGSKQADWQFTPWQKLSQLYNWAQYSNVKRYMPYRSRYNATYVDPALVNPEQAIGDIKGTGHQQLSSLRTLNPILRNAQAASISGQIMNNIPGVRSQYDNQNAQIINQSRQYNNQVKNNESLVNMGNDQTYYQQAIEGRKNFDNMRSFTANNAMNNLFADVSTNQTLAYNMMMEDNPAYRLDWRSGKFVRNPKSIRDVGSSSVNDRYSELLKIVNEVSDPLERAKLMVKLEGLKTFGSAQGSPRFMKKGGKVKKNPWK